MSAERDVNRIVRSWLRTDEHDSADAILGIVLSRLDTTPQRRSWVARRSIPMNTYAKLAIAAAAVLVVAVVGYQLLPSQRGPGTPTTGSSPSPAAAPTDTPIPVPSPNHRVELGDAFGHPVVFWLPDDWTPINQLPGQFDYRSTTSEGLYIGFFLVDRVYQDPCHPEKGVQPNPLLGPLDDDLVVQQLRNLAAFTVSPIETTAVIRLTRRHFDLSNNIDAATAACTNGLLLPIFTAADVDVSTNGGTTIQVWVYGDEATSWNLLVVAETRPDAPPTDQEVIDAIIANVRG